MLLNTIMTNLIKAPVHTKPHSYRHDNRFKTSKQKKNTTLKGKTQVWLVCVVTAWRSHSSQFSLIRYKKRGWGVGRGVAVNPSTHYGTSGWGLAILGMGLNPPDPPGKYSPVTYTCQPSNILWNKKLSCRRETVRCFVSLNISLSQSRSPKVIRNGIFK